MPCSPSRCGSCALRDIEDCAAGPSGACGGRTSVSPSAGRPATSAPLPLPAPSETPHYQVLVIGAGVVGLAIARRLARFRFKVGVVDREADVSQGATKANSGIVHAGYDDVPGTLKSKLCYRGNQMFTELDRDLEFGLKRVGSFVLAYSEEDVKGLDELVERARKNGVPDCQIVPRSEILKKEPKLNHDVIAGLWCPHAGIVSPYEFAIALAQNAVHNGVDLLLAQEVTSIDVLDPLHPEDAGMRNDEEELQRTVDRVLAEMESETDGQRKTSKDSTGGPRNFFVQTNGGVDGGGMQYTASVIVNCAGMYSDRIADMVGAADFTIAPRKGEYLLLNKPENPVVNTVLFPMPSKEKGKGILVSPTYWGQILLGPTSRPLSERLAREEVVRQILQGARRTIHPPVLLPHLRKVLTSYTGMRAKSSRKDFIVEKSSRVPNFVNVAGIDSPGLTSSPAIAEMVQNILENLKSTVLRDGNPVETHTLEFVPDPTYDPKRKRLLYPKPATFDGVPDDPRGPAYNVICRCENVTEEEVVNSIRNEIGARDVDGVKRRVRAGMGLCQGSYCQPRVTKILARELGIPETMVPGRGPGSSLLPHRKALWEDRKELVDMYNEAEDSPTKSKL